MDIMNVHHKYIFLDSNLSSSEYFSRKTEDKCTDTEGLHNLISILYLLFWHTTTIEDAVCPFCTPKSEKKLKRVKKCISQQSQTHLRNRFPTILSESYIKPFKSEQSAFLFLFVLLFLKSQER